MSVQVPLFARPGRAEGLLPYAGILGAVLWATACSKALPSSDPSAKAWPAGTVMALNGVPIRAEEVDEVAGAYAQIEPQDTPTQLRRLALSRCIFPRIAAQGIDPERRERVRKEALAYRAALAAGTLPPGPLSGPMEVTRSGRFLELGFDTWDAALNTGPDRWSEVIETPGSFHIVRVKKREEGALPSLTHFTIGAFDFPYLDPESATADLQSAFDRSRLTILDDAWRDAVPAAWRYRFHAESP